MAYTINLHFRLVNRAIIQKLVCLVGGRTTYRSHFAKPLPSKRRFIIFITFIRFDKVLTLKSKRLLNGGSPCFKVELQLSSLLN